MSAFYACERGESYISLWEYGLGVTADGSNNEIFVRQKILKPIAPKFIATQIGIFYELYPDLDQ